MNINNNPLESVTEIKQVSPKELADIFIEYFSKKHSLLNERVETSRYAVEVNYRTTMDEANHGFAKIALGYISAALKKNGIPCQIGILRKTFKSNSKYKKLG